MANGVKGSKKFFGMALRLCYSKLENTIFRNVISKYFNLPTTSSASPGVSPMSSTIPTIDLISEVKQQPYTKGCFFEKFNAMNGKILECVEWIDHSNATNYVAHCKKNPLLIEWGGVEREFLPLCEYPYYVPQDKLLIGECYEFSSSFKSVRKKRWGIPCHHRDEYTTILFFEDKKKMFLFKEELDKLKLLQSPSPSEESEVAQPQPPLSLEEALAERARERYEILNIGECDPKQPPSGQYLLSLLARGEDPCFKGSFSKWRTLFEWNVLFSSNSNEKKNSRAVLPDGYWIEMNSIDEVNYFIEKVSRVRPYNQGALKALCDLIYETGVIPYIGGGLMRLDIK
jgi:hypothetical protein